MVTVNSHGRGRYGLLRRHVSSVHLDQRSPTAHVLFKCRKSFQSRPTYVGLVPAIPSQKNKRSTPAPDVRTEYCYEQALSRNPSLTNISSLQDWRFRAAISGVQPSSHVRAATRGYGYVRARLPRRSTYIDCSPGGLRCRCSLADADIFRFGRAGAGFCSRDGLRLLRYPDTGPPRVRPKRGESALSSAKAKVGALSDCSQPNGIG